MNMIQICPVKLDAMAYTYELPSGSLSTSLTNVEMVVRHPQKPTDMPYSTVCTFTLYCSYYPFARYVSDKSTHRKVVVGGIQRGQDVPQTSSEDAEYYIQNALCLREYAFVRHVASTVRYTAA